MTGDPQDRPAPPKEDVRPGYVFFAMILFLWVGGFALASRKTAQLRPIPFQSAAYRWGEGCLEKGHYSGRDLLSACARSAYLIPDNLANGLRSGGKTPYQWYRVGDDAVLTFKDCASADTAPFAWCPIVDFIPHKFVRKS